ncbi:MAG TPA: DUF3465 domain-containing protein [Povalibacter sp.]|nr:DUF3465 domain-containing protein [Povalibacter sp.]
MLKKILPIVIVVAGGLLLAQRAHWFNSPTAASVVAGSESTTDAILARAFEEQKSNLQIEGRGVVAKILRDDNDGSRHQRFLVRLNSGQTLLIAHNVDLAPRVADLHEGDAIAFYGEYEWNNKGGVVHWTHRDPSGRHVAGWLEHAGQRYQ